MCRSSASACAAAAVVRFGAFLVAALLAGDIGRLTYDEDARRQPGVAALRRRRAVAGHRNRRTWPWDVAGLVVATATSLLLNDGTAPEIVRRRAARPGGRGHWVAVMRRLAPDVWGAGGERPLGRLRDLAAFVAACATSAALVAVLRGTGLGLVPGLRCRGRLAHGRPELQLDPRPRRAGPARPAPDRVDLAPGLVRARAGRPAGLARRRDARRCCSRPRCWRGAAFAPDPTPFAFSLVLCTVWAAFRLPPLAAVLFAFVLGSFGVVATLTGQGVFLAEPDP